MYTCYVSESLECDNTSGCSFLISGRKLIKYSFESYTKESLIDAVEIKVGNPHKTTVTITISLNLLNDCDERLALMEGTEYSRSATIRPDGWEATELSQSATIRLDGWEGTELRLVGEDTSSSVAAGWMDTELHLHYINNFMSNATN